MSTCEVCETRPSIGVAAVPGIPMSIAWCQECLNAGAIPYWLLVANTIAVGGMDEVAPWWAETVDCTLRHLDKPRDQFLADVATGLIEQFLAGESIDAPDCSHCGTSNTGSREAPHLCEDCERKIEEAVDEAAAQHIEALEEQGGYNPHDDEDWF